MLLTHFERKTHVYDYLTFLCIIIATLLVSTVKAENENISYINNDFNETDKTINQYLNEISELEAANGPHHEAIGENLLSLGLIYQSQGQHVERRRVLEQALHIHRLNYGLDSKEQLPIIEQLISTNEDLQDWLALDLNYEYFYWVNRRVYGNNSSELLPALHRVIEWKLKVVNKKLFGNPDIINNQVATLLRKIRKIKKAHADQS